MIFCCLSLALWYEQLQRWLNVFFLLAFFSLLFYTNLILYGAGTSYIQNTIIVFQKSSTASFFFFSLLVCLFVFIEYAVSFLFLLFFLYTSKHMHQNVTIKQMDENDMLLSVNKMMNVKKHISGVM